MSLSCNTTDRLLIFLGTAKLNTCVIIPIDYPNTAPIFALELDWHGIYNRENSEDIRVSIYGHVF